MRRIYRRAFLALAAALVLAFPLAALADDEGTITGNGVNFRSGPGTSYASMGKFYSGDSVTVTGSSGNWCAVTYNNQSGYVYHTYVSLDGSDTSASEPTSSGTGTLMKYGSTGSFVKQLQGNLIMLGYLNDVADGIFGSKTLAAVRQYQSQNGLTVDGIAGPNTNGAVQREVLRILAVVDTAKQYLGTSYVYGGSSPETGFDCSGLTQYSFAQAGISIPRVSSEQAASGIEVPYAQLRIGDLVAFYSPVSHVGIYIGNGQFIHAPHTGDVVKISSLSSMNLTAIRRFTGVLAS